MMRVGSSIVAIALAVGLSASAVVAGQEAPRKLVAPVRGEAAVEVTPPDTKIGATEIVTTIRVKNVSKGPIAGFRITETWYKGDEALAGDVYRHPRPIQVDEVIEARLAVPRSRVVGARNRYDFAHANGNIKPNSVKTLPAPAASADTKKPPVDPKTKKPPTT
jgi:hypothetical protein